jgi:hypothetical protein
MYLMICRAADRLWWMKIWFVQLKGWERTDDSPLRHFPCTFLTFHGHFLTKLCLINLSFGNCVHAERRRCLRKNTNWNGRPKQAMPLTSFWKVNLSLILPSWGCAAASNIAVIERYQSKLLRSITNAPWYVTNQTLHRTYASHPFARFSGNGQLHITRRWAHTPTPSWIRYSPRQTTGAWKEDGPWMRYTKDVSLDTS